MPDIVLPEENHVRSGAGAGIERVEEPGRLRMEKRYGQEPVGGPPRRRVGRARLKQFA